MDKIDTKSSNPDIFKTDFEKDLHFENANSVRTEDVPVVKQEQINEPVSFQIPNEDTLNKRLMLESQYLNENPPKKQKEMQPILAGLNLSNVQESSATKSHSISIYESTSKPLGFVSNAALGIQDYQTNSSFLNVNAEASKGYLNKNQDFHFLLDQRPIQNSASEIVDIANSFSGSLSHTKDISNSMLVDSPTPESSHLQTNSLTSMSRESSNFDAIQIELKNSLSYIKLGLILDGFDILAKVTDVVVNNCEMLGLTSRENPHNVDRLAFWKGLNSAWLFSISRIPAVQSDAHRLTQAHLLHLRSTIIAWGDSLSRYGLVDYELGLWEAQLVEAIDLALNMYNPNRANNFAETPNQMESPGYNFGNSQTLVKLEEENQDMFYTPYNTAMTIGHEHLAEEEDTSHIAASAILTQLYNLINEPHANNYAPQGPTVKPPSSHEMSPSESNISPEQSHHRNSPVQLENDVDCL